jgi:hypothetical protein
MDILNFISWVRGSRVVTSVDPAKTLIPVGFKDGRRDDDYLTGAITVEDFALQVIPTPEYTEAFINISSAEILNLQATPVTLLESPGTNKYNIINSIVAEYTNNTTPYSVGNGIYIRVYFSGIGATFNTPLWLVEAQSLLEQPSNRVVYLDPAGLQNTVNTIVRSTSSANDLTLFNSELVLDSSGLIADSLGSDGTLTIKISYKTMTFGV